MTQKFIRSRIVPGARGHWKLNIDPYRARVCTTHEIARADICVSIEHANKRLHDVRQNPTLITAANPIMICGEMYPCPK